ncbi:MAG: TM2 domain-containing protein [Prevotella sp.]|nr:TM2 domain-containing protein [Prevotella sp.]
MSYCRKCGREISDNVQFCPYCGSNCKGVTTEHQQPPTPPPTIVYVQAPQQQSVYVHKFEKSKGVALLLCFFAGGFGVHQFYLGNTVQGVFYLLFSWTCIPALISIIDFFILLCMSESYFHQKYDRDI